MTRPRSFRLAPQVPDEHKPLAPFLHPGSSQAGCRAPTSPTYRSPGGAFARAGLEDVRIHDLSHRFASRALALGEGLPMIGKLLGHIQVQTTATYAHLARDTVTAAFIPEEEELRHPGTRDVDGNPRAGFKPFRPHAGTVTTASVLSFP